MLSRTRDGGAYGISSRRAGFQTEGSFMNKTKLPTPSSPPRSRRAPVPLVLVLLVAVQCAGWAEDVRFGAMAGVNFSRFVGSDADDANLDEESLVGFTGGGYLAVALNEIIAVQPEVVFSMKGATYEGSAGVGGFSVNWDYEIRLTYLELPVLIRVSLPLDMPLGLDAYGGMSPAILLGAEYEGEVGGVVDVDDGGTTAMISTSSIWAFRAVEQFRSAWIS